MDSAHRTKSLFTLESFVTMQPAEATGWSGLVGRSGSGPSDDDLALDAHGAGKPLVQGEERNVERLGECHVVGVDRAHVVA